MEAAIGFEPMNEGFADLCLSHLATPPDIDPGDTEQRTDDGMDGADSQSSVICGKMERVAGLEPVTPTLARSCSTS